ncbi:MAG TPA: hypothetical protein VF297_15035 [Pyrinomonadaceae bacterium]
MSKAIRTSALMLLLACSAQAGIMGNESPVPPPSQPSVAEPGIIPNESPTSAVDEPAANGWMGNEAAAGLTEAALELLAVLPSLL